MKKRPLNIRTSRNDNAKLYKSIVENIAPEIRRIISESEDDLDEDDDLEEGELNELFGFGSKAKKPEATLSAENSDEENARIFLKWVEYYISTAGSKMGNAVSGVMSVCSKVLVDAPMVVVKAVGMVLSGAYKVASLTASTIAGIIVISYSALVKLVKDGASAAEDALTKLKNALGKRATSGYNNFKSKAAAVAKEASEVFTMWVGVASSLMAMVAEKIEGAQEAFADWVDSVIEDVTEKVEAAAMLVKTWLSAKSDAVKQYIMQKGSDIKNTAAEIWNKIDKAVRNAYNKVAKTIEDWMGSLKNLVNELGKKIDNAKEATKSFVIDKKDKALVYSIQKAVKGLSDKYKEDEVVAIVRKCYNESMVPNYNGEYFINECYFHERGSKPRKLYENHKKAVRRQRVFS